MTHDDSQHTHGDEADQGPEMDDTDLDLEDVAEHVEMGDEDDSELEMLVTDIVAEPETEGYIPITMLTNRGDIQCRYYEAEDAERGVILVGGSGGGFDSPAQGLYPRLCQQLKDDGTSSLHIQFRDPNDTEEDLLDVLAGLGFLESEGVDVMGLVGHSRGGAVMLQAAAASADVRAVAALSTLDPGEDTIEELPEECAVLLIAGRQDDVVPPETSEAIYEMAHEPKELMIFDNAGHSLDEVADEVYRAVYDWMTEYLDVEFIDEDDEDDEDGGEDE